MFKKIFISFDVHQYLSPSGRISKKGVTQLPSNIYFFPLELTYFISPWKGNMNWISFTLLLHMFLNSPFVPFPNVERMSTALYC